MYICRFKIKWTSCAGAGGGLEDHLEDIDVTAVCRFRLPWLEHGACSAYHQLSLLLLLAAEWWRRLDHSWTRHRAPPNVPLWVARCLDFLRGVDTPSPCIHYSIIYTPPANQAATCRIIFSATFSSQERLSLQPTFLAVSRPRIMLPIKKKKYIFQCCR